MSYDRALELRPQFADAHNNRGVTLQALKRLDDAWASYDRALALRPNYPEAHHNQALLALLLGDFDRGWEQFEWRWQSSQQRDARRNFAQPQWTGQEDISGKTVLLHAEQGLGDTIQFARYAPLVAERGAEVILEVPAQLCDLMRTIGGGPSIFAQGDALPDFDFHCPLLSLPRAFATRLSTIPSATPYLHALVRAAKHWELRLARERRPLIGIAWSGQPLHNNDRSRSIKLKSLLPLLDIDATFVSLQKVVRAEDAAALAQSNIINAAAALLDFADTAALISNLDLVISVDTSVAHLAGAMAKPVWVLLPLMPDWRWLLDREDSPWYPTARLFRQDETRNWDSVIRRAYTALTQHLVQNYGDGAGVHPVSETR